MATDTPKPSFLANLVPLLKMDARPLNHFMISGFMAHPIAAPMLVAGAIASIATLGIAINDAVAYSISKKMAKDETYTPTEKEAKVIKFSGDMAGIRIAFSVATVLAMTGGIFLGVMGGSKGINRFLRRTVQ